VTVGAEHRESFFDAVRRDDVEAVQRLLAEYPSLARARWPGRGRPDGMMRSLGPPPFDQHTWLHAPTNPGDPDDPRFTSTPLHWTRNDAMVRVLVEAGADVNAKGTSGDIELPEWFLTPLWRAAHDGRLDSVRLLVEDGADVNVLNPDGCNQALKSAAENGRVEVCAYLLAHGARPDIISACMLGLVAEVSRLLTNDPALTHHRDEHGRSPLDAATLMDSFRAPWPQEEDHDQVAELLVASGARLDLAHAASLGWLDRVQGMGDADPECVRRKRPIDELLTGGAEFETALAAARRRGREEVARFLADLPPPADAGYQP
jgi:ankyrin repeat protein